MISENYYQWEIREGFVTLLDVIFQTSIPFDPWENTAAGPIKAFYFWAANNRPAPSLASPLLDEQDIV